jgi:ATP-dependent Clp endopeptidase proteolytic subunit ClpP
MPANFKAESGVAEIDLFSDVFPGTAGYLSSQLKAYGDGPVTMNINSPGGDVLEGVAIYNILKARGNVKMRVQGLCASIASIIMMAGKEIEVCKGSFVMVHNPFAMTMGESEDLRSTADVLDKMKSSMAEIYAARTGLSEDEVAKIMDNETWMTADEAVEKGFADKVYEGKSAKASMGACSQYFARIPKILTEQSSAVVLNKESEMSEEDKKKMEALEATVAELKKALADMKASDEPKEDEEEPVAGASADGVATAMVAKTTSALALANKEIARLTATVNAINKKSFEAKVSDAVKAGKLMPAQKAWALSAGEELFDSFLASMGESTVLPLGENQEPVPSANTNVNKLEKKIAKALGLSDADAVKARSKERAPIHGLKDGDV